MIVTNLLLQKRRYTDKIMKTHSKHEKILKFFASQRISKAKRGILYLFVNEFD